MAHFVDSQHLHRRRDGQARHSSDPPPSVVTPGPSPSASVNRRPGYGGAAWDYPPPHADPRARPPRTPGGQGEGRGGGGGERGGLGTTHLALTLLVGLIGGICVASAVFVASGFDLVGPAVDPPHGPVSPGSSGRRALARSPEPGATLRSPAPPPPRPGGEGSPPGGAYPHDHPDHPWHWTRERGPDPAFAGRRDCDGTPYPDLYHHFHDQGYVIFRSCSLRENEATVLEPARAFTESLAEDRICSAREQSTRALSMDADLLELLEYLHAGRRAFPFQTLNFPKGTQQPIHSDIIHFDTMPRTLMSAAWTALEDIHPDSGPLRFYPKSHHLGTNDFEEIGIRQMDHPDGSPVDVPRYYSRFYGGVLEDYLRRAGLGDRVAPPMEAGQTLLWAAGLCHGGSEQKDMARTRLSQVSHYYFEGADYYWVPRKSDLNHGEIEYQTTMHIKGCKSSPFAPRDLHSCAEGHRRRWLEELDEDAQTEVVGGAYE